MAKKNMTCRGSLNLEMVLIIALFVIVSVAGLAFLGGNVSNVFSNVGWSLSGETPTGEVQLVLINSTTSQPLPNTNISFVPAEVPAAGYNPLVIEKAYAAETIKTTSDAEGIITAKLPEGSYSMVVEDRGLTFLTPQNFTVVSNKTTQLEPVPLAETPLSVPVISSTTSGQKVTIIWTDESGAIPTEFEVQTANNSGFTGATATLITPNINNTNSFTSTDITLNNSLYVRVRSKNNTGTTEWSNVEGYKYEGGYSGFISAEKSYGEDPWGWSWWWWAKLDVKATTQTGVINNYSGYDAVDTNEDGGWSSETFISKNGTVIATGSTSGGNFNTLSLSIDNNTITLKNETTGTILCTATDPALQNNTFVWKVDKGVYVNSGQKNLTPKLIKL